MQPRWKPDLRVPLEYCQYIGGLEEYDLWLDTDNDLVIVEGEAYSQWDWLWWSPQKKFSLGSHELILSEQDMKEVIRMGALFGTGWKYRQHAWKFVEEV